MAVGDKIGTYGIWKGEKRGKYDIRNRLNNLTGREWIRLTASVWEFEENHIAGVCANIVKMFTSKLNNHDVLVWGDRFDFFNDQTVKKAYAEIEESAPTFKVQKTLDMPSNFNKKYQLTVAFLNQSILQEAANLTYAEQLAAYKKWLKNDAQQLANCMYQLTESGRYSIVILNEFSIQGRKLNLANNIIHYYLKAGFEYKGKITGFDRKTLAKLPETVIYECEQIIDIHTYILVFYRGAAKAPKLYHQIHLPDRQICNQVNKSTPLKSVLYSKTKLDDIGKKHPATYSYIDIQYLIKKFVGENKKAVIFDPFLGVASTIIAAELTGNIAIGCDLNKEYIELSQIRLQNFNILNFRTVYANGVIENYSKNNHYIIQGDSTVRIQRDDLPNFDYCVTSPPYHNILRNDGKGVRNDNSQFRQGIQYYSEQANDLGNQPSFEQFIALFSQVMTNVYQKLNNHRYCSIVISDFTVDKKEMDVTGETIRMMENIGYIYIGTIILNQSQKVLYPFGYPYKFILNHVNQYILNFKKEEVGT